jgi:hypothetical protein
MRALRPSELTAILPELQRQLAIDQYNEQRNRWAFLAAVITNGFGAVVSAISGFGKRRYKHKTVEPDDFMSKDAKKMLQRLLGQGEPGPEQGGWSKHIEDARAKGLAGPW